MSDRRNLEQVYDEISYSDKEMAGLPNRYYELTPQMVHLLQTIINSLDNDIRDELSYVVESINETRDIINNIIKRG